MDSVEGKKKSDVCQPCQEVNVTNKAHGLCRECKEYMCKTCFQHHLKARYCRQHVLLDLSEAKCTNTSLDDVEKCVKHGNETVRFYCRKHDLVGCGDCMLFDGHSSCHPEYIQNVSLNFRKKKEFENLTEKLETLKCENSDIASRLQKDMEDNNEMNKKLVDDIRTFRNSINMYLDKSQDDCLSYANKLHSENDNLLVKLETGRQDIASEIEEYKKKLNSEHNPDHVLFIHSVTVKSKLKQIEDAIKTTKSSARIDHFEFNPDKQLHEIITKSKSLGLFERLSPQETSISASIPVDRENQVLVEAANETTACKEANLAADQNETTSQSQNEHSEEYWIFVKFESTGKTERYVVNPYETISKLKEKIHDKEGIPAAKVNLKLPFLGKQLQDRFLILDYSIQKGSTVICALKLDLPKQEATH